MGSNLGALCSTYLSRASTSSLPFYGCFVFQFTLETTVYSIATPYADVLFSHVTTIFHYKMSKILIYTVLLVLRQIKGTFIKNNNSRTTAGVRVEYSSSTYSLDRYINLKKQFMLDGT